jgi:hypothetical protein
MIGWKSSDEPHKAKLSDQDAMDKIKISGITDSLRLT